MLNTSTASEFLASLERLSREKAAIPHEEMVRALDSLQRDDFPAADWNKVVDFSVDQLGRWQVKWLFSPAKTPDADAQAETEAWERLWGVLSKALADEIPGLEAPLREKKDLLTAQYLLEQKLRDRGDTLASSAMGRLALALNGLGLRRAALWSYKRALYPPGSVGRSDRN